MKDFNSCEQEHKDIYGFIEAVASAGNEPDAQQAKDDQVSTKPIQCANEADIVAGAVLLCQAARTDDYVKN